MSPLLKKKKPHINSTARNCAVAGIIAVFVMFFVLFCHDNTLTFGKSTVLRMDLYHQYGPLYAELYDRITNGYSLVYSWTSGLGGAFLGNLFNYCCSPFALIMLLCGHENMPEAIALMIVAKAVLASMSFTFFLSKHSKRDEISSIGFGLLYAFCSYFVAYSWNIMWLDGMAVFPLVMLGIEYIVDRRKPAFFCLTLAYTMITNYYIAFMVCILSVIYYLFCYFSNYTFGSRFEGAEKKNSAAAAESAAVPGETAKKTHSRPRGRSRLLCSGFLFAGAAVVAGMLSAFALLPVWFCLKTSSATGADFPTELKTYFNIFDFIINHLPGLETTIRSSGSPVLPNVYCGTVVLLLVPFYFLSDRVSAKKKVMSALVLGLLLISFCYNYLNFIWHGLHFPNDLPYRFSFAYSFFLLLFSYEALLNIKEFSRKTVIATGMLWLFAIAAAEKCGQKNIGEMTVLISVAFVVIWVVILGMYSSKTIRKSAVGIILVASIAVELCAADTSGFVMSQPKENYTSDYAAYQVISEMTEKDDEGFYRTELSKLRARMDPSWYGYNGVSVFSSMAYEHAAKMMNKLGFFSNNINSYTYFPQTAVFNSMFSMRYVYDNYNIINDSFAYEKLGTYDKYTAYKNKYELPLMYTADPLTEFWDTSSTNPFSVQNDLVFSATGVSGVFVSSDCTSYYGMGVSDVDTSTVNMGVSFQVTKSSGSKGTATLGAEIPEDGVYYVYVGASKMSGMSVLVNDYSFSYSASSCDAMILDVGSLKEGNEITVNYSLGSDDTSSTLYFACARLDEEKFLEAYGILASGAAETTFESETEIKTHVTVESGERVLWTSIPYDESWNITINGKKAVYDKSVTLADGTESVVEGDIFRIGDALIGIRLKEAGEYDIDFEYVPRGFSAGVRISLVTFFGIIIAILLYKLVFVPRKKRRALAAVSAPAGLSAEKPEEVISGQPADAEAETFCGETAESEDAAENAAEAGEFLFEEPIAENAAEGNGADENPEEKE